MANDRGTLRRGPANGTGHQPPGWEPTGVGERRLPAARRERKPALAALALLLIVGGAVAAGYLVLRSGQRVAAIEISQPIGAGQQIPVTAMRQVEVASGTGLPYVPWSEASQVARYYAKTAIPAGTLLTSGMVEQANQAANGRLVMGLALKDGQLPDGLAVGDHVDIYEVNSATDSCPGAPGMMLARDAVVLAITSPSAASGSNGTDVQVAVTPVSVGQLACNVANGYAAIAVLPASGFAGTAGGAAGGGAGPSGSTPGAGTGQGTPGASSSTTPPAG